MPHFHDTSPSLKKFLLIARIQALFFTKLPFLSLCIDYYPVICTVSLFYVLRETIQNSGIFRTLFIQVYLGIFKHTHYH